MGHHLSRDQRREVVRRVLSGVMSFADIGREYGVTAGTIEHVAGQWGHRRAVILQMRRMVRTQNALLAFRAKLAQRHNSP